MVVHHALYAMHSCADVLNLHRNLIQKGIMLLVPNSSFDHTIQKVSTRPVPKDYTIM